MHNNFTSTLIVKAEVKILNSNNIVGLNQAIHVLRHFVELSAKLLPFLNEINEKVQPTDQDLKDRTKILKVFRQYKFDSSTSRTLMDSEILYLIKKTYLRLSEGVSDPNELYDFREEYERLAKNWTKIDAN